MAVLHRGVGLGGIDAIRRGGVVAGDGVAVAVQGDVLCGDAEAGTSVDGVIAA